MKIRELTNEDLQNGFLEVLSVLSDDLPSVDDARDILKKRSNSNTLTYVAITNKVIGTASIVIEHKFLHGKNVGHIEDVAVLAECQKQGIGRKLLNHIINEAKKHNCYKLLLDCKPELMSFYGQLGFKKWNGMRLDL